MACTRFAGRLPASLGDGLRRRRTVPADPHVAAYGDPPVLVRCAAPRSTAYRTGDPLVAINGIGWFAEARADVVVWSVPRGLVNVEVTVPKTHTGDRLARLTDAVLAAESG